MEVRINDRVYQLIKKNLDSFPHLKGHILYNWGKESLDTYLGILLVEPTERREGFTLETFNFISFLKDYHYYLVLEKGL